MFTSDAAQAARSRVKISFFDLSETAVRRQPVAVTLPIHRRAEKADEIGDECDHVLHRDQPVSVGRESKGFLDRDTADQPAPERHSREEYAGGISEQNPQHRERERMGDH